MIRLTIIGITICSILSYCLVELYRWVDVVKAGI